MVSRQREPYILNATSGPRCHGNISLRVVLLRSPSETMTTSRAVNFLLVYSPRATLWIPTSRSTWAENAGCARGVPRIQSVSPVHLPVLKGPHTFWKRLSHPIRYPGEVRIPLYGTAAVHAISRIVPSTSDKTSVVFVGSVEIKSDLLPILKYWRVDHVAMS